MYLKKTDGHDPTSSSWWFQPIWKNMCQIASFPQVGMKINKYLKPPPSHVGFQVYQDISGINSSVSGRCLFLKPPAVELSGFFMASD